MRPLLLLATLLHPWLAFGQGVQRSAAPAISGWCRCSIYKSLSSASYQPQVFVPQASSGEVRAWTAAGTETVYIFGGQLTATTSVQYYTPTITGPVSRKVYRLP